MPRIDSYPEATTMADNDAFILESANGSRFIKKENLIKQFSDESKVEVDSYVNNIIGDVKEKVFLTNTKVHAKKTFKGKKKWVPKTWNGLTDFGGMNIWTDGENIYFSNGIEHYVLDKSTSTWGPKIWNNGFTDVDGANIWTDGENIYYSYSTIQYVLNKATSTWSTKTWSIGSLYAQHIWTDGENIYYSKDSSTQYVLNRSTMNWENKSWNKTYIYGSYIWTDGDNIYMTNGGYSYVLNKATGSWSDKSWSGVSALYGNCIWSDGENIYYKDYLNGDKNFYILNKTTSTWSIVTFEGNLPDINAFRIFIWTDGENIYYSGGPDQYMLVDE